MSQEIADVIIIGAGIVGSSTAYSITKNLNQLKPAKVKLFEQFKLFHHFGSSHGNSRIIRKTYTIPLYSEMANLVYPLWKEYEKLSNQKVLHITGGLDFGPKNDENLQNTKSINLENFNLPFLESCDTLKIDYEYLNSEQLKEKFPQLKVKNDWIGIYQKDAGLLNAEKAVEMMIRLAEKEGCEIHEEEGVIDIKKESENLYKIITKKGYYYTRQICICAGAWAQSILGKLGINIPLEVWRCTYAFWEIQEKNISDYQIGKFPVWIYFDHSDIYYGFPCFEYPNKIKASMHYSYDMSINPDLIHEHVPSKKVMNNTKTFMENTFNGLTSPIGEDAPTTCLYTVSEDENFILDVHPTDPNIVFFAGGSGHAFKFGPILGEFLSDLLLKKEPIIDLSLLKLKKISKNGMQTVGMLRPKNAIHSKM